MSDARDSVFVELYTGLWARLFGLERYARKSSPGQLSLFGEHDVSQEPRDAKGEWTAGGPQKSAKPDVVPPQDVATLRHGETKPANQPAKGKPMKRATYDAINAKITAIEADPLAWAKQDQTKRQEQAGSMPLRQLSDDELLEEATYQLGKSKKLLEGVTIEENDIGPSVAANERTRRAIEHLDESPRGRDPVQERQQRFERSRGDWGNKG